MASYDSDSSSDNGNGYKTTNVVLGYASNESSGDDVSHIGGHPIWSDIKSTPPPSFARCRICNDLMSLLLQLNADLQQHFPGDQRRLQVWNCKKTTCTRKPGSMRVIREVRKSQGGKPSKKKETAQIPQESAIGLGNALFGGSTSTPSNNVNPFSTESSSSSAAAAAAANPFSSQAPTYSLAAQPPQQPLSDGQPLTESFAEKLKIGTTPATATPSPDPWPETEQFPPPYPFFYLDAYPEEIDTSPEPVTGSIAGSSKAKFDIEDSSSSAQDKDAFESALDKTFQKFSDIVAQNPEQVLRYEFKGQPLLYSGTDGVASRFIVPHGKAGAVKGMPRCEKCGSQRVFEMQLTPYLIYEIEKDEATDIDSGMEWGAVVVGTCSSNCGEEGAVSFREEWVGVQWEERVARK